MLSPAKDQARDDGNDYGEDDFDRSHRRPRIGGLMPYHDQTDRDPKKRSCDDRLQPIAVAHGENGTAFQNSRKYSRVPSFAKATASQEVAPRGLAQTGPYGSPRKRAPRGLALCCRPSMW